MPEVALAFYWHQHQPYYPDDVAGENPMPWVRLHGVKDYYGMALHLLEFPAMRCTINLVRSDAVKKFVGDMAGCYERVIGPRPEIYVSRPAEGASEFSMAPQETQQP